MSESVGAPIGADLGSQTELRQKLGAVIPGLNQKIAEAGTETRGDAVYLWDQGVEVSGAPENKGLYFWGGLTDSFGFTKHGEPTAIIKRMILPDGSDPGTKTKIADAWEGLLNEQGVNQFAATNIRDIGERDFWRSRGFVPRGTQDPSGVPYAMVKISPAPIPVAT